MSDVEQPSLREITGGRFAAVCGKCLRPSAPMAAEDGAHAWEDLKRGGWIYFWPDGNKNLTGYAVCPACAHAPEPTGPARRKGRRHR